MTDPIRKFKTIILEAHMQGGGKISKLEANYTNNAQGQARCEDCANFEAPTSCRIVEGLINPGGWCKYFESGHLEEKWGTPTKVSPSEKGKYKGKSKSELQHAYSALKKSGPHKKGSPGYDRMRELAFAIRAKSNWGKIGDE